MPRPPVKKKHTPSFPNLSVAKPSSVSTLSPARRNPGRQASERISSLSDDSEGLVTTTNRFKRRKAGPAQDATMSGGLGVADVKLEKRKPANARPRPVKTAANPEHVKALEGLKRRKDAALKAQKEEVLSRSTAREETVVRSEEPHVRIEKVAPEVHALETTVETQLKSTGTSAIENSVLAIANFKRRPRQPSILRMVQQDSDNDDEDASLNDFNPEDESTPLNLTKSTAVLQPDSAPGSPSQAQSSPNPRKRKLSTPELQVPRSSPPLPSPEIETAAAAESDDENPTDSKSLPKQLLPTAHLTSHSTTPQPWSETMAPPQSSSPVHPTLSAPTHHATKSFNARTQRNQPSRAPAPTSSPNISPAPPRTKSTKPKPQKPITTASLQTFLPRRRRRDVSVNEFDIPSSDSVEHDTCALNPSDDELTHLPATKRKKATARNNKSHSNNARNRSPTKKSVPAKKSANQPKEKEKDKEQMKRTYTRRRVVSSDKENSNEAAATGDGESGDSSLSTVVGADGECSEVTTDGKGRGMDSADKEMTTLAKKFREVDKWQMEFEEITASSSSPVVAR